MKKKHFKKIIRYRDRGFALIATISIMSLVVLLALAMLSLASVVSKTSGHSYHIEQAKANARLALNEAIYKTQLNLGPDQRITARGDIDALCHVSKKHYLGVYNTAPWHERDADHLSPNLKPYDTTRSENDFLAYLVSGLQTAEQIKNYVQTPITKKEGNTTVDLLSSGSTGSASSDAHVFVPIVFIENEDSEKTGAYAWWVSDEGMKANYTVHDQRNISSEDTAEMQRFLQMNPSNTGVDMLTDMSSVDPDSVAFKNSLPKVITRNTAKIHLKNNSSLNEANSTKAINRLYHDVTVLSQSVLSSTARPGLKHDLSLPFELPDTPTIASLNSGSDHNYVLNADDDYTAAFSSNVTTPAGRPSTFDEIWEFNNSGDKRSSFVHARMQGIISPSWWNKYVGYLYSYPNPAGGYDKGNTSTGNTAQEASGWTDLSPRSPKKQYLRGPSWALLRHHYRQYKREYESLNVNHYSRRGAKAPANTSTWLTRNYLPNSIQGSSGATANYTDGYVGCLPLHSNKNLRYFDSVSHWKPFFNYTDSMTRKDIPYLTKGHTSYGLTPAVTKIGVIFSVYGVSTNSSGDTRFDVCMDMIGTVWNPYNVPLECKTLLSSLDFTGVLWDLELLDEFETKIEDLAIDYRSETNYGSDKFFPFHFFRFGVTENGSDTPTNNWTLQPGETRTYTLSRSTPYPYEYARLGNPAVNFRASAGQFSNNWRGGVRIRRSSKWLINIGNKEKLRFRFKPDINATVNASSPIRLRSFLGYNKDLTGGSVNPFDANEYWDVGKSFKDQPELGTLHINDPQSIFPKKQDPNDSSAEITVPVEKVITQMPTGVLNKQPVAYFEFSRHATDTAPKGILFDTEPRSIVNHPAVAKNESNGIPEGWKVVAKPIGDFAEVQAGIGSRNHGFFGSSHSGSGEEYFVAFEIPTSPIANIGLLSGLQTGPSPYDTPYAIGGNVKHPLVAKNALLQTETHTLPAFSDDDILTYNFESVYEDRSYLINTALWDNYFFSGIQLPTNTAKSTALANAEAQMSKFMDPLQDNPLNNKRLVYWNAGNSKEDTLKQLTHYRWMAQNMMLQGGFNINSTSQEAWKAVLGSLRNNDIEITSSTGSTTQSSGTGTPMSRMLVGGGDSNELWKGYFRLTDAEINTLATEIVKQVRLRGPFFSVVEFVNRRIATDATGDMGAIQAALEAAKLTVGAGNEKGITGTIRQNDVLASIGGVITARSDTFIVRAYGDSRDANGNILAKAYCEATLQRTPNLLQDEGKLLNIADPNYISSNEPAHRDPYVTNPAVSNVSRVLGRRFIIQNFRWLNPAEL